MEDSFTQNIKGVQNLIGSSENKTILGHQNDEGVEGDYVDVLTLDMSDEELIRLRNSYELKSSPYHSKIKPRQEANKIYYKGKQKSNGGVNDKVIPSNLIFESVETFIPQALAKNPEPVVFSDNTDEGKAASDSLKTMLQYHADVLCLRKKLGVMVRQWSNDFTGIMKYGWNAKINEITVSLRRPKNFVFDPDGYINEFGDYIGDFLGERIPCSAEELIEMYPEHKEYILLKSNGKLGTILIRTEWWNDDYCFTTFLDVVLDKHKNEFFNYDDKTEEESATPGINHFAVPKLPYTFLSIFSLQEEPLDITNLTEQAIPNQDRICDRDVQISKNLASANNSVVLSGTSFTAETASQAVDSFYEEGFILVPDGKVDQAVKRLPANNIPDSIFKAQEIDKDTLRSVYGVQGLVPQNAPEQGTARGMILNQSHDSTRIGGGVGDALEQVADNLFNWLVQLYCVFYDTPHYGAIMGNGRAVEYTSLINSNLTRKFVVSVAPNSMKPKDEISEMNMAIELWNNKAIDPIGLYKKLNDADPMQSAKRLVLWTTNPQQYMMQYFPEVQPAQPPQQGGQMPGQGGTPPPNLGQEPANASLQNVPLNNPQ